MRRRIAVQRAMAEVRGQAVVGTPKDHERRDVPVPAFLVDELAQHVAGRSPSDLVFPGTRGGFLRNGNFRRDVFDAAAERAGLVGVTPHGLRHTAASLAIAAGASVVAVQKMLGHSSPSVTLDVYSHLFPDDLDTVRSEERRVGKECKSRWTTKHYKKKKTVQMQEYIHEGMPTCTLCRS